MGRFGAASDNYLGGQDPRLRRPFNFTPNLADPELISLRNAALGRGKQNYLSGVNELARAGLTGSSVAMNQLDEINRRNALDVEGVEASQLARQRAEALGLYQGDIDFERQLLFERMRQKAMRDAQARQGLLSGLSDIGQGIATYGILRGGV